MILVCHACGAPMTEIVFRCALHSRHFCEVCAVRHFCFWLYDGKRHQEFFILDSAQAERVSKQFAATSRA